MTADVHSNHERPTLSPPEVVAKFVSIKATDDWAKGGVTILTQAVAVKETGPKETVSRFGEIYAFSPTFLAIQREKPTVIRIWNLQPDDEHDFALYGPKGETLLYVKVPPLKELDYVMTFHQEGVFEFKCLMHQPMMSGQILVTPTGKQP